MAAVVEICEYNKVTHTETASPACWNPSGTNDDSERHPADAIAYAGYSYEKWYRVHLVSKGDTGGIKNIRVWVTGQAGMGTADTIKTNAVTTGYSATSYTTPVNTVSPNCGYVMPDYEPNGPNLGIVGSLSSSLTTDDSYSDHLCIQVRNVGAAGFTRNFVLHFAYDEV